VLADLHDIESRQIHWSRYFEPTIAPRLIIAKLANKFFGSELRRAAEERDTLVKELSTAFQDPKATFEGLKDNVIAGYQKDWQDFKAHMSAGTLEGRFRAGMIFGKLLMVILGVLTGVYGAVKVGAKVVSKLPRLAEFAKKLKFKRGEAHTGGTSGEAMTPSQMKRSVENTSKSEEVNSARAVQTGTEPRAKQVLGRAKAAEPRVTEDISQLAKKTGGTQEGLDFRLKSEESLTRKLDGMPRNAEVNDALRYTVTYEPSKLGEGAASVMKGLENQGYEKVLVKNTFVEGQPYKGINTTFRSPDGQLFELQFHTPQSFDVKQNLTHALYEQARVLPAGSQERAAIGAQMKNISDSVQIPKGIQEQVPNFRAE
jgi:hypothetical protein